MLEFVVREIGAWFKKQEPGNELRLIRTRILYSLIFEPEVTRQY